LPYEVRQWAGLNGDEDPIVHRTFIEDKKVREEGGECSTLSSLNDAKNGGVYVYDFNRIASVIDMAFSTEDISQEHCRKRAVWELKKTQNEDFNYEKY